MSRIRSIHPGIWTDEEFVTLSPMARLLFIGLWNECDDKGAFEWKPLTIKMRLLPADNIDVAELLSELADAGCIARYEVDGKAYGAVRNFRKFQRPKTPNDIHPMPDNFRIFVGLSPANSETGSDDETSFPNHFGNDGEIGAQMEEEGKDGGKEKGKKYFFSAGVVRLSHQDYEQWRKRFHAIPDIDAELTTLATWLEKQPDAKRKDWFATGASWLNRRHQEAVASKPPDKKPIKVGI